MVVKREASCPLCGARMQAAELLDACDEVVDASLGVLSAHCPYCQGYLEVMPREGFVDIGYLAVGGLKRFEVALTLPCDGLTVRPLEDGSAMALEANGRRWRFGE
jgi:hypothetical protein